MTSPSSTVGGQLLSVNVARIAELSIGERQVPSAIAKRSVSSLLEPRTIGVAPLGLGGDEQADLSVHGGLSKAVYAYPSEHLPFWQTVRAQAGLQDWHAPLAPGRLGENLTISGLLESQACIGDVLVFPDCELAISEPRRPCDKFQSHMGFAHAVKMMVQSGYCGFYLAVRRAGSIAAGQHFALRPGPQEVSVRELFLARVKRR